VWSVDGTSRQTAAAARPSASVVSVDNDDDEDVERITERVLDSQIDDFLSITDTKDRRAARRYLTSNQLDLRAAVNNYFEDLTS